MVSNKTKKAICIAVALSLMANLSPQVYAGDLVAIPQNNSSIIIPPHSSIVHSNSTNFSMKSIEAKMSNILNPAKKEGVNQINRKQLATNDSGSCGTSVTYTFTASTGELKISGSGAMNSYPFSAPWNSYRSSIKSVTIGNGVTKIGSSAFSNCYYLTSVTIPDSVTTIGSDAFYYCSGLTSVTIPDSVTSIDGSAFRFCSGLTSINVDENNTSYKSIDGILYSYDGKTLIQCPGGKTGSITIPNSVTSIGSQAFYGCSKLTSVTIGNSVTSIGSSAFYGCEGLKSVTIPDSVTTIGAYAFNYCTGLIGQLTIPDSVTEIGYWAFCDCFGLTSVTIGDKVTTIRDEAFRDCSELTSVTIPDSVTSIGYDVFKNCLRLTSVSLNNDYCVSRFTLAFPSCSTIKSIVLGDKVTTIDYEAFWGCTSLTSITIPDSVTSIGSYAFRNCSGLTSVTIGNSVTSIGEGAFSGCSRLTSITIPASVTEIGSYAFSGCKGLTSITIPDSVTLIGSYAFSGCSKLTSITIPDSVTSIGYQAFRNCSGLTFINVDESNTKYKSIDGVLYSKDGTSLIQCPASKTGSITIPASVTEIGSYAFSGCSELTYINVDKSNTKYKSIDGVLYSKDGKTLILCPAGKTGSLTIPDSVTTIGSSAFSGCSGLKSVTISDSVTSIGSQAFSGCSKLTSVTYAGTTEPNFSSSVFSNCDNLWKVEVSNRYKKDTFCGKNVKRSLPIVLLCADGKDQYFDSSAKKIIVCKKHTNRCKYQRRVFMGSL